MADVKVNLMYSFVAVTCTFIDNGSFVTLNPVYKCQLWLESFGKYLNFILPPSGKNGSTKTQFMLELAEHN